MAETRLADYLVFLRDLGLSGADYFLEGGQAFNFWAEYYSNKGADEALGPFAPFTSKDCDIWVSMAALRHIESRTEQGTLRKGDSPAESRRRAADHGHFSR